MPDIVNEAAKFWEDESNCAQAVASGVLEYYDMSEYVNLIHDSMIGFGGGMGERSICGAVTCGLSALGIIMASRNIGKDERSDAFTIFKELFVEEIGTLNCEDIIEEFILPDGSVDKDRPERRMKCTEAVETAAKFVEKVLEEL
ncbi:MAG: C-GCAxxG-C-C family protein [Candidatus Heimdallarchaeaceae archaeon]